MKKKFKYVIIIVFSIVALAVFCIVAIHFDVMPIDLFPNNFIGAILGALIGSLITVLLLIAQTNAEEKKGKDIRILEMKTEVFKKYINKVWAVWTKQEISFEIFQDLVSRYYKDLMICISDPDRLNTIGENLSTIQKNISDNKKEDLRDNIINIINELSAELELGGEINKDLMKKFDARISEYDAQIRGSFRDKLIETLNNYLPTESDLKKGEYKYFKEGQWNLLYICFDFKNFDGCKLIIGAVENSNHLNFALVVDTKYEKVNSFRAKYPYNQRIAKSGNNLCNPITGSENNDKLPIIDFKKEEVMEYYRKNYIKASNILAERVAFYYNEFKIDNLGIIDFLKKYCSAQ